MVTRLPNHQEEVMLKVCRGIVAMLALVPAALAAQTPEVQITRALERAVQAGVPVELLESKVAEGRAKGVPADRIAAAVQRRLEVLERVQQQLAEHRLG